MFFLISVALIFICFYSGHPILGIIFIGLTVLRYYIHYIYVPKYLMENVDEMDEFATMAIHVDETGEKISKELSKKYLELKDQVFMKEKFTAEEVKKLWRQIDDCKVIAAKDASKYPEFATQFNNLCSNFMNLNELLRSKKA